MAVRIVTDGSADLPQAIMEEFDIIQVPLFVCFKHEQFPSTMDRQVFYEKMKTEKELPKTSSPSPHAFYEQFQTVDEADDIICISLSSALSATYQHAVMGKQLVEEESSGRERIHVIDSKNASLGLGLLVYQAARLAKQGSSLQELLQYIGKSIPEVKNYFVLDTLMNVVKGGRLDHVRGAIASVLNIKLIMKASAEGSLEVVEKVRGSQNAILKMIDRIGETVKNAEKTVLGIAHSNCEQKAKEVMRTILSKYPFKDIIFSEMGPVIGTYAGEGAILVACMD
ncbi:DegV family protein [Gorillibacterium sp. CAU 1737]|uniref:DegV family protein n=1 Tax=Gorillibacterium sp. CAU 1737 TaxID=3140362 RepID=UPI0032611752